MRISDWSSDVCSSDLLNEAALAGDHDGARDGDTRAGQRALLAHLADLEIERAGAVHHPPPVLREPRQRRRRKLRRETVAAGVRRGAHAVVEYALRRRRREHEGVLDQEPYVPGRAGPAARS